MQYFLRLLVFALLSEIPFDMAFRLSSDEIRSGVFFTLEKQNVMWTLLLGFLIMAFYETAREWLERGLSGGRRNSVFGPSGTSADEAEKEAGGGTSSVPVQVHASEDFGGVNVLRLLLPLAVSAPVLLLVICGAEWLKTDYHGYGVAAIAAAFLLKKWCFPVWTSPASTAFILQTNPAWHTESYAAFAMPLLFFYNGKKGRFCPKYFFYAFYPVHLLVFAVVKVIVLPG